MSEHLVDLHVCADRRDPLWTGTEWGGGTICTPLHGYLPLLGCNNSRVPPVVNEESTVKQSFCVHEFNRLIMSLPILYMHIESTEVLSLITWQHLQMSMQCMLFQAIAQTQSLGSIYTVMWFIDWWHCSTWYQVTMYRLVPTCTTCIYMPGCMHNDVGYTFQHHHTYLNWWV